MNISRRGFIGGASASFFISGCLSSKGPRAFAANEKVNVAIIGCGLMARSTNVPGFLKDDRCRVVIACDMVKLAPDYFYDARESNFGTEDFVKSEKGYPWGVCGSTVIKDLVDRHYGDKSCREVFDWRDVIDDPSVDAVVICTPDHWHAIISIAAMKAGKHVFCQKPMTMTVAEGRAVAKVAKETGMTFQVGNQGATNPAFRLAEEIALNGYAGKIKSCTICMPSDDHWIGHGRSTARLKLPSYFSEEGWNLWQGCALHWENNAYIPSIHGPTCWRFNDRYGGGMITDYGAHEFDELQRGLGMQEWGPVAIENMKSDYGSKPDRDVFSWPDFYDFDIVYGNGIRCHVRKIDKAAGFPRQTIFHCEKGDVGSYSNKGKVPDCLRNFKESDLTDRDIKLYRPRHKDGSKYHESDFLDGVIEGSQNVASTAEFGHRTITIAHIANICAQLQLPKLNWDPKAEVFTGPYADEANRYLTREYYNGFELGA